MKLGLIGAGRRMGGIYLPLLEKIAGSGVMPLKVVGFTTRSSETARRFQETYPAAAGLRHCATRDDLMALNPDVVLICVNYQATPQVLLTTLRYGVPILIETPIEDARVLEPVNASGVPVGVMEQWPYLPLEQFKEAVYGSGIIARPHLVVNDCRSFDYHAAAQVRTYIGRQHRPVIGMGRTTQAPLVDHITMEGGRATNASDSWEVGIVQFDNGAIFNHLFSYACKTAPFRSIQSLRGYSSDGTIVTGRMLDRTDDYEIIDIEYVMGGITKRMDVVIERAGPGAPSAIYSSDRRAVWTNEFTEVGLSDMEVAMASHLRKVGSAVNGKRDVLYPLKEAIVDQFVTLSIKHSHQVGSVVRLS